MQNIFENDYRTSYIIEKILDYLPGNPQQIIEELTNLLQRPNADVLPNRNSNIQNIRDCLKDPELAVMTRHAIQKKIYALKNLPSSTTKINYLVKLCHSWLERTKLITAPNNAINQQR